MQGAITKVQNPFLVNDPESHSSFPSSLPSPSDSSSVNSSSLPIANSCHPSAFLKFHPSDEGGISNGKKIEVQWLGDDELLVEELRVSGEAKSNSLFSFRLHVEETGQVGESPEIVRIAIGSSPYFG